MALTRKMLSAMGIEAEKIEQIVEGNAESLAGLNEQIDKLKADVQKYKTEAEKVAGLQKDLETARKEAETAKNRGEEYEKLKKEYEDYKAEVERKAVRAEKEAAYKEILKDAGIAEKHWAKILKYSDVDGVELDEKGKITTAKEILKEVKEEWSDHIEKEDKSGVNTPTPPANNGGSKMTKEEIMKIKDTNARQKAISENHELFGY